MTQLYFPRIHGVTHNNFTICQLKRFGVKNDWGGGMQWSVVVMCAFNYRTGQIQLLFYVVLVFQLIALLY